MNITYTSGGNQNQYRKIMKAVTLAMISPNGYNDSPADINNGSCSYWALAVRKLIPTAILLSHWGHAFICLNYKYYDAEHLLGVNTWRELFKKKPKYGALDEPNKHTIASMFNRFGSSPALVQKIVNSAKTFF